MDELSFLQMMQEGLRTPWLDAVMVPITMLGNGGVFWLLIGIVLLCMKRYRRVGVAVIVAVALSGLIAKVVLGALFPRPRPCDVDTLVQLAIARPFGSSFPSGHTTAAFAAVSVLIAERMPKRLTIPLGILAMLIGFSRLYLYVHYPTDVLAGAALGIAVGIVSAKATECLWRKYRTRR